MVYRHLTPRDLFAKVHPGGRGAEDPNGLILWEGYAPPPKATAGGGDEGDDDDECGNRRSTRPLPQDRAMTFRKDVGTPLKLRYRRVAPPYQNSFEIFPGVLDELLRPENLAAVTAEAASIPQWTAWPETTHYSTVEGGGGEVSWTVFPLCHTFPADIPENRRWISRTCEHAPETTRLLKTGKMGRYVRTALFSRLRPGTNLGAHTGWSDLANHVLRVHVPLIVPGEEMGLCGTWVDGCVEIHRAGVPLCFDDSKVHRAFNYYRGGGR